MTDPVLFFQKKRHSQLVPGVEFTAWLSDSRKQRVRLRFRYARPTPKGWELTGWDGNLMRTVRAEHLLQVHRTVRIPKM